MPYFDFNIQKESTFHPVLGLHGGTKKRKKSYSILKKTKQRRKVKSAVLKRTLKYCEKIRWMKMQNDLPLLRVS